MSEENKLKEQDMTPEAETEQTSEVETETEDAGTTVEAETEQMTETEPETEDTGTTVEPETERTLETETEDANVTVEAEVEQTSEVETETDEAAAAITADGSILADSDLFIDKSVYEQKTKMKKAKKIAGIIAASVGGLVVVSYLAVSIWFSFHFNKNTYIDGQNVSFHSVQSVKQTIDTYKDTYSLTVEGRENQSFVIKPEDIGLTITAVVNEDSFKKKQHGFLWFLYLNDKKKEYHTKYQVAYDEEKLEEFLAGQDCLQKKNMEAPEDAYVVVKDGKAEIIPETEGTLLDTDKMKTAILSALNQAETSVSLDDKDCYETAEIKADSAEIAERKTELEKYLEMTITYEIDRISWTLDASTFGDWLYYTGKYWKFKPDLVKKYVEGLAEKYDTVGTVRTFQTYTGRYVEEIGSRYGWAIDTETETKELQKILKRGESQTRTPAFLQTGAAYTKYDDIGYTYIEVDLSNQHVYLIVNGSLVTDTPCVTGCVADGHGTPDGLYSITYTESPSVLVGEDYESKVTFWMPFNRGIGLHDATWRGSFGGNIYYSSGSHGCVNLPYQSAAVIYSYAYAGMPVICYY